MADDIVIKADQLSKAYRIWTDPSQRLISPLFAEAGRWLPGSAGRALNQKAAAGYRDFFALQDVSFEVKRGEAVGIIGRNGSGKSTLLQIIAGTMQATRGSAKIKGRVAALLELGSGFNPEFTGRENVYLNGAVLGLTRREVDARFDDIAAFADIGEFMDQSVKTYSSGMMVRLAFAVQTSVEPDIFIVDEALSVGDFFFQQKCFKRIAALRARGTTLLFVSHDMGSVRDLCSRTLYLRAGQAVFFGDSQQAIARFYREDDPAAAPTAMVAPATVSSLMAASSLESALAHTIWKQDPATLATDAPAALLTVEVLNENKEPALKHRMGGTATIRSYIHARQDAEVHVAVEFKNRHGQIVSSLGTKVARLTPLALKAGQIWRVSAQVRLGLESGQYSFQLGLGRPHTQPNLGVRFAETPWLGPLTIDWDYTAEPAPFLGLFDLPAKIEIDQVR